MVPLLTSKSRAQACSSDSPLQFLPCHSEERFLHALPPPTYPSSLHAQEASPFSPFVQASLRPFGVPWYMRHYPRIFCTWSCTGRKMLPTPCFLPFPFPARFLVSTRVAQALLFLEKVSRLFFQRFPTSQVSFCQGISRASFSL